jgi:ethanolamine utilization protein EutA
MHEVDEHDATFEGGVDFHYQLDNVTLTTIGVDIGSSTFHFMFGRVHLRRASNELSSRFEVVSREVLWRSPVRLTPYAGRHIDAVRISEAIAEGHAEAGVPAKAVDTGAVILTGEALHTDNARALGEALAATTGDFVCVSAGHQLESMLAAFGSGAVAAAENEGLCLLHVDIGGGTTKLAIIDGEGVRQTAAFCGGGRIVVLDEARRVLRSSAGATAIGRQAGAELHVGATLSVDGAARVAESFADVVQGITTGDTTRTAEARLRLTPILQRSWRPNAISFSGGVSEYIYGREDRDFGDLGPLIGAAIRRRLADGRIPLPLVDPGEGIRATVIGAAQSSMQLSGNTIFVSRRDGLPLQNIPVIHPLYDAATLDRGEVAEGIRRALSNYGLSNEDPVAVSLRWLGAPSYQRLKELASGIGEALGVTSLAAALVLVDEDIAASLGRLLVEDLAAERTVVCLDGIELKPLDYVDVGRIIEPANVLPVVIKSLLFDAAE